ncbi:SRPBCC family protein [Gordonia jinhuaensis]|uniref:Polyketide cyclase n=2 Tax=Gordonia jinhuaensis TaxID=1517702 RepID=A0A916T5A6_9ACTN|nr:polyketide cyclase [Gordonia jinhuaensis]
MTSSWSLPYSRDVVFDALADADSYRLWWPQVREVRRLDETHGTARLRALIPMALHITLTQRVNDAVRGELRADLTGDLVGWTSWHIHGDNRTARAEFAQEAYLVKKGVPTWSVHAARPILVANHRSMMWSGRRGLIRHLAGS